MRKPKENAVATEFGWVNPDSGELLVSVRGLPNPVKWRRGEKITQTIVTPIQEEVKPAAKSSVPKKTSAPSNPQQSKEQSRVGHEKKVSESIPST
jgi:hypothetical protein